MATSLFPVTPTEGVNFNLTYAAYNQTAAITATNDPAYPGPPIAVGTVVKSTGDGEFVFVLASATINLGDVCQINTLAQTAAPGTSAAALTGNQVGVAQVPIANGQYGWLQRAGKCDNINAAATTTQNAQLAFTATAGVVSSTTSTFKGVNGLVITTTTTGAATTPGTLNFPVVGPTL